MIPIRSHNTVESPVPNFGPRFRHSAWSLRDDDLPRFNLFTEIREIGKPGDFDHMTDEDLTEFIEVQCEVVRELERQLLPPPAPKQRKKGATKH